MGLNGGTTRSKKCLAVDLTTRVSKRSPEGTDRRWKRLPGIAGGQPNTKQRQTFFFFVSLSQRNLPEIVFRQFSSFFFNAITFLFLGFRESFQEDLKGYSLRAFVCVVSFSFFWIFLPFVSHQSGGVGLRAELVLGSWGFVELSFCGCDFVKTGFWFNFLNWGFGWSDLRKNFHLLLDPLEWLILGA